MQKKPPVLRSFGGDFVTSLLKMTGSFSIQSQRVSLPCTAHSHEFLEVAYVEKGWATHTLNGVSRS